ncbi:uncharacterized mitochondrial protein-like protein [Tanacetum coccineum]
MPVSQAENPLFPDLELGRTDIAEYGVSTSIGYGVSNFLSNTAYSFKLINTAYPLPLDTAYRSSGTEADSKSSTNELFTPYKEPKREFRSSRRHFKTLSLDELRSPDFNLLSDQEHSEKEEAEAMAETMEQYMKNTFSGSDNEDANEHIEKVLKIFDLFDVPNITEDHLMLQVFPISLIGAASRWLRNIPTGSIKTWEDLKTKFLNKYRPPGRTAKKMKEINNFQQEPDETLYQAWECFKELLMKGRSTETSDGLAAIQAQLKNLGREINIVNEKVYTSQVGCKQCKRPHYTKDCPLKEEGKTVEEAYYTQLGRPFQGGGYRATAPGYYQRNNVNPSYQERRKSIEDTLSKFMSESTKRHEENSNLIKEIRATTDAAIRNQGASTKTLEIQIGKMNKVRISQKSQEYSQNQANTDTRFRRVQKEAKEAKPQPKP